MKASIITVVYNNADTIAASIESVLNQDYKNIEYIVVDGQSNDGTLEVIQKYAQDIDIFVSEEDAGLYDALNKGIALATGDIIGILHADDIFNSRHSVSEVIKAFKREDTDCVYGDLVYVDRLDTNTVIRNWKSGKYERKKFLKGWMPPHPTFYVKRECFQENGTYDTSFSCSGDYELMLRYLYKNELKASYVDKTLVRMRVGGVSNNSLKGRLKANREDALAWKKNDIKPLPLTHIMKPLRKIGQLNFKEMGFKFATYFSLLLPLLALIVSSNDIGNFHDNFKVGLAAIFSWGVVVVSIPVIIKIAEAKQLMDSPNHRSSHTKPIPTLGGIAIFASLLLSLTMWGGINEVNNLQYLLGALTVIFFIGLKDDMLVISPRKKLMAQIIASFLIVQGIDLQLESFYGILGIGTLPYWFSLPFTILVFVLITNAYNLIDGIDGLASLLGMIAACFFGAWFFRAGHVDYAILAFSMLGALAAFIKYNFSKNQKIFLGDTGSLIIGILCATLMFQFIKLNAEAVHTTYYLHNAPVIAIAILGISLFDLLRLFVVRLYRKQSPFSPDRNHIHHLLIDLNFTHRKATIVLGVLNIGLISTALLSFTVLNPTVAFLLMVLYFLFHIILCHQLQFSNPRVITLFFLRYIRLLNGKRVVKPIAKI